eukprot:scaffold14553_cov120-Isochrysis_galbana.AAC.4
MYLSLLLLSSKYGYEEGKGRVYLLRNSLGVSDWFSGGHSEAIVVALRLTMLPCACSRGRFGDAWMSMTVSFGAEAEGAARASAGNCSMLNQK